MFSCNNFFIDNILPWVNAIAWIVLLYGGFTAYWLLIGKRRQENDPWEQWLKRVRK